VPVYEYECAHCGVMEISQSIKDATLTKCPKCRRKVKKIMSMNSFVLKGSGWYATDYAKKSDSAVAPKPTECPKKEKDAGCAGCEAKAAPAKASTKSESKSASAD